jgi:hypothetical protein
MMEMIALYLEQTPRLISAIKKSMKDQDVDALYAAIHKMIPSFRIVGLDDRYERLALKVQESARKKELPASVEQMVLDLELVCIKACTELEEAYKAISERNE